MKSPDRDAADELFVRLNMASVAACECLTKTPDPSFHKPLCRYRVLQEAASELATLRRLLAEADEMLGHALGLIQTRSPFRRRFSEAIARHKSRLSPPARKE